MNARREYWALLTVVAVIGAVGVVSSVAGIADRIAVAVLMVAGLVWLAVVVLRREWRIRARLADPRTQPAPRSPGQVPHARVGPGDRAPVPPAPTCYPGGTP
jgi:hypothetical protein